MESNREKMVSEHKVSETFGGYIRQITFNNGENFEVCSVWQFHILHTD